MKRISVLLALVALMFTDLALAAGAVVTSLTGTAQVQTGAAAPRALRQGDQVAQGDTVSTGPASSVVLRFDDGQVAALTANSRMQVTAYAYNAPARSGNILLSLVVGGMRVVTGLIGHNSPQNVNFRAATATIGIRGSAGSIVIDGVIVVVSVSDGALTFTYGGETIVIPAGSAAFGADGKITQGTVQEIFDRLSPAAREAFGTLERLTEAINEALARLNGSIGPSSGTPGPNVPPGGGSPSNR